MSLIVVGLVGIVFICVCCIVASSTSFVIFPMGLTQEATKAPENKKKTPAGAKKSSGGSVISKMQKVRGAPYAPDGTYLGDTAVDWTKYGCNTDGLGSGQEGKIYMFDSGIAGLCHQEKGIQFELCECEEGTWNPKGITLCAGRGKCKDGVSNRRPLW